MVCLKALSIKHECGFLGIVHHAQIAYLGRAMSAASEDHRSRLWIYFFAGAESKENKSEFKQYHIPCIVSREMDDIVAGVVGKKDVANSGRKFIDALSGRPFEVCSACVLGCM